MRTPTLRDDRHFGEAANPKAQGVREAHPWTLMRGESATCKAMTADVH